MFQKPFKPRVIRHFHFKSWPDKDVPDNARCFVDFWRAVDTDAPSNAGPIVVHCRYVETFKSKSKESPLFSCWIRVPVLKLKNLPCVKDFLVVCVFRGVFVVLLLFFEHTIKSNYFNFPCK